MQHQFNQTLAMGSYQEQPIVFLLPGLIPYPLTLLLASAVHSPVPTTTLVGSSAVATRPQNSYA